MADMKKTIPVISLCLSLLCSCGSNDSSNKQDVATTSRTEVFSSQEEDVSSVEISSSETPSDSQKNFDVANISDEDKERYLDAFNRFTPEEEDTEETKILLEEGTVKERYTIVHATDDNEDKRTTHSVFLANYGENMMKYIEEKYQPVYYDGWDFEKGEAVEYGEKPDRRKETEEGGLRRISIFTEWSGVNFDDYNELSKHPKCFKLTLFKYTDGTNIIRLQDRIEGTINFSDSYYTLTDEDHALISDALVGLYLNCDE
ncbi:MAG: hypothetical protein IJ571_04870 [Ruminococcus sp.]|nr:hypothetical protein [Ruminococcus sp.]